MLIALPLLLLGCPDPSVPEGTAGGTPSGPGNPTPGGDGAQQGPANPPGGDGSAGPGTGAAPGGSMAALQVEPGQGVTLSGTFEYSGSVGGTLRVDLVRVTGGDHNEILHAMTLDSAGPWSIEVPKDLGKVQISAFIDANGDGPSPGEPTGMEEIEVGSAAVPNIKLTLTDTEGAVAPAGGGATTPPPDGAGMGSQPGGEAPPPPDGAAGPAGGPPPAQK